ncbi:EboA domain-containing protein [Actinomadura algeriensis]|uniref:Sugar phosphate isomerase n=1 Tax=Actinomadura algeriensis TaxID=1679523 RepID=A0ABR9JTN9_9ACTN|nr:EboA domain-containing protein [Actinomadura algeriensis]MBE1533922.1 hypothetical protein [Actinomadura algeriensis]
MLTGWTRRLDAALADLGGHWPGTALHDVEADPARIGALFPAAAREYGREPLRGLPGWTADEAVRVRLLLALPARGAALAAALAELYAHGDPAERVAVLRGLAALDAERGLGERGLPLVADALRANDTRLVSAAMGPYAAARLPAAAYRQAVLKCVFVGIPLAAVAGLPDRADAELARMLAGYAAERRAAGRDVPPDIEPIVHRHRTDQG